MLDSRSFLATLSVIIISELGDKTFFIAAIMAMTHSQIVVFFSAISALIVMTILSVFLGMTTSVIPKSYTHFASIILFLGFGFKMLWDAKNMSGHEAQEEYEEVKKELAEKNEVSPENGFLDQSSSSHCNNNPDLLPLITIDSMEKDDETGILKMPNGSVVGAKRGSVTYSSTISISQRIRRKLLKLMSLVFLETFTMTFLAEWGDRSQITTIILAAREDPLSVSAGAIAGHAVCSLIAVLAGRFVSQMISARTVTLVGGSMFLAFALYALLMGE